jgi:4-fold beta flower protein
MKYSEVMHANKEFDESGRGRGCSAIRRGATDNVRHRVIRKERGLDMEDAIYAKSGAPVGFHDGQIIYDLQGQPIGQLRGSQVYCMGGHHFGELKNGVILDKKLDAVKSASSRARGNPGMRSHGSQRIRRNPRQ